MTKETKGQDHSALTALGSARTSNRILAGTINYNNVKLPFFLQRHLTTSHFGR